MAMSNALLCAELLVALMTCDCLDIGIMAISMDEALSPRFFVNCSTRFSLLSV